MANAEHLEIMRRGVGVWNQWRKKTRVIPDLDNADLSRTDLRGIELADTRLHAAYMREVNLCGANLKYAMLGEANLTGVKLSGADLSNADFHQATLSCANLSHANVARTNFSLTDLSCANFTYAHGDNVDFSGANLRRSDLRGANFSYGTLKGVDLSFANLIGANLCYAYLAGATLWNADLSFASLSHVSLKEANLGRADLSDADLTYTDLFGTDFQRAIFKSTKLGHCSLIAAKGLDLVKHAGPCAIGIDTIYLSRGRIPESFLRGCGVPETFIRYIPSLVNSEDGIQFYSCFISYSGQDEDFAKRLYGKMRDARLRVWFAPEEMKGGNLLIEQIETAIRVYDKLLLVLSQASLKSPWVITELRQARKAERQSGKRKLFPVRLADLQTLRNWECFDADIGRDLAVEVREYFIPDFSNWKDHDHFEAAFARLLKDLRAEERAK